MKGRRRAYEQRIAAIAPELGAAVAIGLVAAMFASGFTLRGVTSTAVHPASIALMLGLLSLPLIRWAAERDQVIERIMFAGLIAKGAGTAARVVFNQGGADALYYDRAGSVVADLLSAGFVAPGDVRLATRGTGTNNLTYVVGWLYNYLGANIAAGYLIFSFIAFVGMLLFYRAAVVAIPGLQRTRYALLLFFMPSMLFWPSSLGKDAWMVGCLGLASLGAAGIVRHRYTVGNLLALVAGVGLASWIRPHIAALLTLALGAALVWPSRTSGSRLRQLALAALALLVLTVILGQVADFFGAERFEVTTLLDETAARTAEGGAQFRVIRVSGPLSFGLAALTVLARPLLLETNSMLQLLNSIEAMALFAMALASFGTLRTLPRAFLEEAYVRVIIVYTLGFIMAFSVISNFGILARQRVQLWPFLLVLLALPHGPPTRWRRDHRLRAANRQPVERPTQSDGVQPDTGADLYVP